MGQERKISSGMFSRSEVIDLARFRQKRQNQGHTVFYLSSDLASLETLQSLQLFLVEEITSWEQLSSRLLMRTPEMIVIDSTTDWERPLTLIQDMQRLLEVPIVLLCDRRCVERDRNLIKKSYAAGVSDTLYFPLEKQEVYEALSVLLKFQKQFSKTQY